jgi:hypothetical protein
LGIPLTDHVTAVFDVPATVGLSVVRWVIATDTPEGATATVTALTIVTVADTVAPPATAWMVTGLFGGKFMGALYCATVALVLTMLPSVALPPGIPFTSQTIGEVGAGQKDAVKDCVEPSATFVDAGEIELAPPQTIVTAALADFELSATLAAVTLTVGDAGGSEGAV